MPVTSLLQHYDIAVQCFVRSQAVLSGALRALFCESELTFEKPINDANLVSPELVKESSAARTAAADYLAAIDAAS